MAEGKFSYDPEKNYDEETLAQQRDIERQVAEDNDLVGRVLSLEELVEDYAKEDEVYRLKLGDLQQKYKCVRKTRGDGNCFYRAFGFSYLERLLSDAEDLKRFKDAAIQSKDELLNLGFPQFTIEDFHDTFMDVISQVEKNCTVRDLEKTFNDQGLSDYFIVYLRLIVSGYLQKESDFFSNFIEGEQTVKEFCSQEVEPMAKESDHIHIIALSRALGVRVRVEYMDRGLGPTCNHHDFPEDYKPKIFLLYRPGHYDILYVPDSV